MVQMNVDEYVKFQNESVLRSIDCRLVPMNVFLRKWMTNNANERIFIRNEQQKVYIYIYFLNILKVGKYCGFSKITARMENVGLSWTYI